MIELIVVITIIAVITAIATVNFGGINKKSRDSKRQADLERIRMALEVMRQVNGVYPTDSSSQPVGITPNYLTAYPVGPNSDVYVYDRLTEYTYTLDAWMEVGGGAATGYSCGTSKPCNYRVTQP